MRLKDKIAVIVGAGQQPGETVGNGRATAVRFAQEGATLVLVDSNPEWAAETLRLVEAEGGTASTFTADITREDDCRAIAEVAKRRHGRIDILHNNVGRSRGDRPTTEMDADMWDELMTLNVKGMFMTCKHVLPIMREQKSGAIVNISSTSSICARQTIAYKTGKGAVNTMTQHLAWENAPYGIRVNAIIPGLIDTPMAIERRASEQGVERDVVRAARHAQVPLLKRMGTAWDVANAALFLASDEACYTTGTLLPVDGGLLVKIG